MKMLRVEYPGQDQDGMKEEPKHPLSLPYRWIGYHLCPSVARNSSSLTTILPTISDDSITINAQLYLWREKKHRIPPFHRDIR